MASKKTIAIIGATGAQGGGLAHAILSDQNSEFQVRAVTRDPGSDKAQKLASLGAEVVKADLDNLESLKRVFKDAYGIFCVTNYWEHFSTDREIEQASNMAKAASNAGAKHVIWSTLEDTRGWIPLDDDRMPTLKDKYKVPHFDAKGEANSFFTKHDVPTTFMMASFYWDNMIFFGMGPQKDPNGNLSITFPMGDKKMPGIAAEDIGKCAYGIFKKGSEYIGKTVGIAGEHLSGNEMAAALSKAFDKEIHYNDVPADVYRSFGFPGADDLGNMFQFYRDFNDYFRGARDVDESRALNPSLLSFDQWLAKNKDLIPIN